MATSDPISVPHPYTEVFRTLVAVLPQNKMQVVGSDEANGVIHAKTGIGLRTWGENLTIRLGSHDGGKTTEMVIDSNLKFGITAWGKHDTNFATITEALRTAFAGPVQAPPAQPAQPPPPQASGSQPPPPQTPPQASGSQPPPPQTPPPGSGSQPPPPQSPPAQPPPPRG